MHELILVRHKSAYMNTVGEYERVAMDRDDIDVELRDIDERILDMLEKGRCTRKHLADELGVTGEYIYQRVDLLIKLGLVHRIHNGFYEIEE